MKIDDDWTTAAVEKRPPGVLGRAASLPRMILPLVCLVYGISNLVGIFHWVDAQNVVDHQTTFICGATFTILGGLELRFCWRRLWSE
jgi:hypothetical protein